MTEDEWLNCDGPNEMVHFIRHRTSERKQRLIGCGCCRRLWALLRPEYRRAVEVAEGVADGAASDDERSSTLHSFRMPVQDNDRLTLAVGSVLMSSGYDAADAWDFAADAMGDGRRASELLAQVGILHDLFGNPFRPVAFDPAWQTSTAGALARQMYEFRDFGPMPILADALQDAGCDEPVVLDHCRGGGSHVRGCWVVDLILGKE